MLKRLLLLFIPFFILLFIKPLLSQTPVLLNDDQNAYILGPALEVLEDTSAVLTIEQVSSKSFAQDFIKIHQSVPNFGHTHSAYWIRFKIQNKCLQENRIPWILDLDFANIYYLDLYQYSKDGKLVKEIKTGSLRPLETRDPFYNKFAFVLACPFNSEQIVYLRIKTDASMTLPLTFRTMENFIKHLNIKLLILGIFFGILLIILSYNIFFFISLRNFAFLYFSLAVLFHIFYHLSYSGLGFLLIWPDYPALNAVAVPIFSGLMIAAFTLFTDVFMKIKTVHPGLHWINMGILSLILFITFLTPFIGYYSSIRPLMVLTMFSMVYIFSFIAFLWKDGNRAAGYFLLSGLGLLPGSLVFILVRFGFIASTLIGEVSFKAGSIIFLLFISQALIEQIKALRRTKESLGRNLFESEGRFRSLVETSADVIWEVDKDLNFTYISPTVKTIIGWDEKEFIGHKPFEFMEEPEAKRVIQEITNQVEQDVPIIRIENTFLRPDKSLVVLEKNAVRINDEQGQLKGFRGIDRDITERKTSELLKQVMQNISDAVLKAGDMPELYKIIHLELNRLIDASNLFIGLFDKDTNMLELSYMKDEKDEYSRVPLKQTLSAQVIEKRESLLMGEQELEKLIKQGKAGSGVGTPCKIWLGVPLQDEEQVLGVIVVQSYTDPNAYSQADLHLLEFVSKQITLSIKQKQAEDELRRSEENFRSIFNNATVGIATAALDGTYLLYNCTFSKIIGYSMEEQKNISLMDVIYPDDIDIALRKMSELRDGKIAEYRLEERIVQKDGTVKWIDISVSPQTDSIGTISGILMVILDITDRHQLQEQLLQTQKLDSIGTLAGGIAHDFNNILTVINGYAEISQLKLAEEDLLYKNLSAIRTAGEKAENLTRQILTFSRKQMYRPQVVRLDAILKSLQKMIRRLIGEDISIHIEMADSVPNIKADPGQMEQIFINLIVNARDAVNEKTVTAADKNIHLQINGEAVTRLDTFSERVDEKRSYLHFSVHDNGIGMTEEVRLKVFEPFFTTKKQGKGTGLGLSTVYGIIRQNEGLIEVQSTPGKGTIFNIFWPVTEDAPEEAEDLPQTTDDFRGNESILLVEDEQEVRNFARSALEEFGYTVIPAGNGKEAVKILESNTHTFDLVVTDVVMPDMNGMELYHEISQNYPALPVLFTSGYTDTNVFQDNENEMEINFLKKPYTVNQLLTEVREVLSRS